MRRDVVVLLGVLLLSLAVAGLSAVIVYVLDRRRNVMPPMFPFWMVPPPTAGVTPSAPAAPTPMPKGRPEPRRFRLKGTGLVDATGRTWVMDHDKHEYIELRRVGSGHTNAPVIWVLPTDPFLKPITGEAKDFLKKMKK